MKSTNDNRGPGPDIQGLRDFAAGHDRYPLLEKFQRVDPSRLSDDELSRDYVSDWIARDLLRGCFHEVSIEDSDIVTQVRRIFAEDYILARDLPWKRQDPAVVPPFVAGWLAAPAQDMVPRIRRHMRRLEDAFWRR